MPKEVDAITKVDDYILWIIPKLEKFPRSHSFDNLMLAAKKAQKGKRKSE